MKLSKSDKIVLLVFLVVLIIALGGWLLVYPAYQKIGDAKNDLEAAKVERDQVYANLERENTIDDELKQAIADGMKYQKSFYNDLTTYEADRLVREILEATNMQTNGLTLSAFTTQELSLVDFVEIAVMYPLKEYAYAISGTIASTDPAAGAGEAVADAANAMTEEEYEAAMQEVQEELGAAMDDLYFSYIAQMKETVGAISVNFDVTGTRKDYLAFLDYVKNMDKATYIDGCEIAYTGTKSNGTITDEQGNEVPLPDTEVRLDDNSEITANITITFFCVEPLEQSSAG